MKQRTRKWMASLFVAATMIVYAATGATSAYAAGFYATDSGTVRTQTGVSPLFLNSAGVLLYSLGSGETNWKSTVCWQKDTNNAKHAQPLTQPQKAAATQSKSKMRLLSFLEALCGNKMGAKLYDLLYCTKTAQPSATASPTTPASTPMKTATPPASTPEPTLPVKTPTHSPTATTKPTSTPDPTPSGQTTLEQQMVELVNSERAKAGLPALKVDATLTKMARAKSQDMIDKGYFDHTSPTYGSPFEMMKSFGISYRTAGENIAYNSSVTSAHTALMNSSGHRANILNASFTKIGIGIVRNSRGVYYISQEFIG